MNKIHIGKGKILVHPVIAASIVLAYTSKGNSIVTQVIAQQYIVVSQGTASLKWSLVTESDIQ